MSDIPRYKINILWGWQGFVQDDENGKFCEYRDYLKLKAELNRLKAERNLPFAYGGKQLLIDLNKLLTAHRKYCDINAIDYTQMEKDALS